MAQNKSTAVGRVRASVSQIAGNSARNSASVFAFECSTPRATPIAAATPIAGAPRITMSLIALRDFAVIRVGVVHHLAGQSPLVEHHNAFGRPLEWVQRCAMDSSPCLQAAGREMQNTSLV